MFGSFTPSPLVSIWNWFILYNSRNLPYYIRFSMTPPSSDPDIISGRPRGPLPLARALPTFFGRVTNGACRRALSPCFTPRHFRLTSLLGTGFYPRFYCEIRDFGQITGLITRAVPFGWCTWFCACSMRKVQGSSPSRDTKYFAFLWFLALQSFIKNNWYW